MHRNLSALVVPPEQSDVLGVFEFQGEKQSDGLYRVISAIHKVPNEDKVGLWQRLSYLQNIQDIEELSVDVSYESSRRADGLNI